jgi:hypothetical protein
VQFEREPLLSYAALLVAAASPPGPEESSHYLCQATARWGHHAAWLNRTVDPQEEGPNDTNYQVSWSKYGKGVAELIVGWTIKGPAPPSLPDPDSLYFDFPMRSPLRGGTILLVSSDETVSIRAKKPAVHFIGGHFHSEAVHILDASLRTRLARGGPWRYVAIDGRGRMRAEGALNLPGWAEMERRYSDLRAELDKNAAEPDSACLVIPIPEEQF